MLTLQAPAGFVWRAGQYIALPAAGETLYLSIANTFDGSGRLEVVVGLPSEIAAPERGLAGLEGSGLEQRAAVRLAALPLGGRLHIEGPYGSMCGEDDAPSGAEETRVLVGHGTGIAPLRALWQAARRRNQPTLVIQGARTAADLLFCQEFSAPRPGEDASRAAALYWPTLTAASADWTGRRGRVQNTFAELSAWVRGKRVAVFACGRQAMVDDLRGSLLESGCITESQLRCEAHG